MDGMKKTPKTARLTFYVAAVAFVLIVALLQTHLTGKYADPLVNSLSPVEEKQLDALLEMNRLLTTLSTTLLAAMGFLLIREHKPRAHLELWTALASGICVFLSLFFGYLVYLGILWMLGEHFFNLTNPHILWARQAHFYTFLLGVVFFADFAFHYVRQED
jgi:uncharacterized membrane protein YozB (DUF420 family)